MDQNFNLIIKNNYYEVNIINSNLLYLYKKIKNKKNHRFSSIIHITEYEKYNP